MELGILSAWAGDGQVHVYRSLEIKSKRAKPITDSASVTLTSTSRGGKWERTKARNTRIINVINKELLDPRKEQGVTSSTHCVPRHSYKTDSLLLDFQLLMGLSIFIAESLAIFHPQLQVIETAHLHRRGGWGELPLRGWGTRPDPGSAQGSDWSSGSIPGFWLAAGNTGGLSDLVLAGLPALTSQNHLLKHFNILPVIGKFESS